MVNHPNRSKGQRQERALDAAAKAGWVYVATMEWFEKDRRNGGAHDIFKTNDPILLCKHERIKF